MIVAVNERNRRWGLSWAGAAAQRATLLEESASAQIDDGWAWQGAGERILQLLADAPRLTAGRSDDDIRIGCLNRALNARRLLRHTTRGPDV